MGQGLRPAEQLWMGLSVLSTLAVYTEDMAPLTGRGEAGDREQGLVSVRGVCRRQGVPGGPWSLAGSSRCWEGPKPCV